jgi:cellulose synthase/poly-beta-1,6-N-acetylglucosamine synthase-like glycosyltransferase
MPLISIIVPCYNEEATIGFLLEAILRQTFPILETEVIISDGLSTDRTRDVIASFHHSHPELSIRIVDNTLRKIPSGLNRALEASQGRYVIRLDAHSIPAPDYLEKCVQALESGKGENVGGVWRIRPGADNWISRSIALAAAHPLGVGDARYRVGGIAQVVDTVPFGAFRRDLIKRIGLFDESLLTNEDYEFNVRVRQSGGKVWFDPKIQSTYIARSTFMDLFKQYWRYGYWKARMLHKYPATIRWRQALPPLFVLSLFLLIVLSPISYPARWLLLFEILVYLLILIGAGLLSTIKHRDLGYLLGIPLAIAIMHLSWATAFLWGMLEPFLTNKLFIRKK